MWTGVRRDVAEDGLVGIGARWCCERTTDFLPEEGARQADFGVEDGDDQRIVVGDSHHGSHDTRSAHHAHVGLDTVKSPLVDGVVDFTRVVDTVDDTCDDDRRSRHRKAVGSVQMGQLPVGFGVL